MIDDELKAAAERLRRMYAGECAPADIWPDARNEHAQVMAYELDERRVAKAYLAAPPPLTRERVEKAVDKLFANHWNLGGFARESLAEYLCRELLDVKDQP